MRSPPRFRETMSSEEQATTQVSFSSVQSSTAQDWAIIQSEYAVYAKALPDRILGHLRLLQGETAGFPVDRLTHSLQAATRAHRDGREAEYVICALLHDIGDTLAPYNHAHLAAAILRPFVSAANHWMLEHHDIFQGYYFFHYIGLNRDMREAFRDHPYFAQTEEFCARYDAPAFDADGETLPLSFFEPMLRLVLANPRYSIYTCALE